MKNLFLRLCLLILCPIFETQAGEVLDWIFSVPFQRIEAGSFTMGSPQSEEHRASDEDQVRVQISRPFEIMQYEVTQSQWLKVMWKNTSRFKSPEYCDDYEQNMCPNHPVEQVSWSEVQEFIRKLNEALGLSGCDGMPSSSKGCYRLPTEAEWEYSARAGTTTSHSFDLNEKNFSNYMWYDYNSDRQTHKVGLKKPNPWGLYDVHGNVAEWVQDSYVRVLLGGKDPLSPSRGLYGHLSKLFAQRPFYRVIRGGNWDNFVFTTRSANRTRVDPRIRDKTIGFRLVRTL